MKKKIIPVQIRNEQVIGAGVIVGAEGSGNDVILQLHFGQSWDGLVKYVTFRDALGENPTVVLLTTDMLVEAQEPETGTENANEGQGETCPVVCSCAAVYNVTIPFSAKAEEGKMMVTVQGYELNEDGSQVEVAAMTATAYFRVLSSDYSTPEDGSITPDLATQIQAEIQDIVSGTFSAKFKKLTVQDLAGETKYRYVLDKNGITVHDENGTIKARLERDGTEITVSESDAETKVSTKGIDSTGKTGGVRVSNGSGVAESGRPTIYFLHNGQVAKIYGSKRVDGQKEFWIQTDHIKAIGLSGVYVPTQGNDLTDKSYVDDQDDEIRAIAEGAAEKLEDILLHEPWEIKNTTWWRWDESKQNYVDTGKPAMGASGSNGKNGQDGAPGEKGEPGEKGDPAPAPIIGPARMIQELEPGQRLLITSGEAADPDWSGVTDPMTEISKLREELSAMKAGVIELNVKVSDWTGSEAPYYASLKGTGLGERYGIVGLSETATRDQREAAAEAQINLVRRSDGTRVLEAGWIKPEMDLPITIMLV